MATSSVGKELESFNNVRMLKQDALRNKNNMSEAVLSAVREQMAEVTDSQFKLAANLPYNVATPILSNLLAIDDPPVLMAATIQKEYTKLWSVLSSDINLLHELEAVFDNTKIFPNILGSLFECGTSQAVGW